MNVNGVGSSVNQAGWAADKERLKPDKSDRQKVETLETDLPEATQPEGESDGQAKGVMRLLQEGHFKGVADVRLRINFADKIAALDGAAQAEKAAAGVAEIQSQVTGWPASEDLENVPAGVTDALEAFGGTPIPSEDPLADLQTRFNSLLEQLRALAPAQPEEPPVEPVVEVPEEPMVEPETLLVDEEAPALPEEPAVEPPQTAPPETEEQALVETLVEEIDPLAEPAPPETEPEPDPAAAFDWESFIGGLEAAFDGWVGALESGVASTSVLPPLSQPSGNGQAYAKFLEIYQNMTGPAPGPEPDEPSLETLV